MKRKPGTTKTKQPKKRDQKLRSELRARLAELDKQFAMIQKLTAEVRTAVEDDSIWK